MEIIRRACLLLITVKQEYWGEATLPFGGF